MRKTFPHRSTREKEKAMGKTVRARYSKGLIEPLEAVDVPEGTEISVTILDLPALPEGVDALEATFGGWKDLIDAEELKRNIYADRLAGNRPEVKL